MGDTGVSSIFKIIRNTCLCKDVTHFGLKMGGEGCVTEVELVTVGLRYLNS